MNDIRPLFNLPMKTQQVTIIDLDVQAPDQGIIGPGIREISRPAATLLMVLRCNNCMTITQEITARYCYCCGIQLVRLIDAV